MYLFNKMRGIFVVSFSHEREKKGAKKNEGEALLFVSRRFFLSGAWFTHTRSHTLIGCSSGEKKSLEVRFISIFTLCLFRECFSRLASTRLFFPGGLTFTKHSRNKNNDADSKKAKPSCDKQRA